LFCLFDFMNFKEVLKLTGLPVLFASLCCLTPIILVLFGLSGLAFAGFLADNLYYNYKWVFRVAGLLILGISLAVYFRKRGVCTLDQVKKQRNKVINVVLLTFIVSILGYLFWLYVVLEYIGKFLGIWQ